MMYYGGGAGWFGWFLMGVSMIAFWAVVITLAIWTMRSFGHRPATNAVSPRALHILQERFAQGELTSDEYARQIQVIHSTKVT
jgi:uncharacterized membrane protein